MSGFQGKASSPAKLNISRFIASYLGWDDLTYDTKPTERKFNIWYFYDPTKGSREIEIKAVTLKYQLPTRHTY